MNIAVVGCGYWGKNLARCMAELGSLHTLCDSDAQAIDKIAERHPGVHTTTQFEHVLEDRTIDGVVVATPATHHYEMARQVLLSGKDVFVEKPLALTMNDGEELVRVAEAEKRILMVGHLLEHHPAVLRLKELSDTGQLGKIRYVYSNRLNLGKFRTAENVLWSFAPHDISAILLLVGESPQELSATGGQYLDLGTADVSVITMSFQDGARAHVFVSWLNPFKEQKLVVIGDKAMAVFDDAGPAQKLLLYEYAVEWAGRVPSPRREDARQIEYDMTEPLKLECQHFLDCVLRRDTPTTDGADGLRVLKVLDACQRSQEREGRVVSVSDTGYFVHNSSIIEEPVSIGESTKVWHFCHIMPGASIGKNCTLGQNVFVAAKVVIGDNAKIQNDVSIFEGVTLEDDVFCGPSSCFTNVARPRSRLPQRDSYLTTVVGRGASVGANATIICGHSIGKHALVGAGSVVTRDVPDYALVYGNPARTHGWVCECGERISFEETNGATCSRCGLEYSRRWDTGGERVERTES